MRIGAFIILAAVAVVGCAGQPPSQTPLVQLRMQPAALSPAASTAGTHRVKVDASNVVAVQLAGYKLVTKEGTPLYCRTDPITGSRIQTRTTCLTEQELKEQMNATSQRMEQLLSQQVGPSGQPRKTGLALAQ